MAVIYVNEARRLHEMVVSHWIGDGEVNASESEFELSHDSEGHDIYF